MFELGTQLYITHAAVPLSRNPTQLHAKKASMQKHETASEPSGEQDAHAILLLLPFAPAMPTLNDQTNMMTVKAAPTVPQNHNTCAGHGSGNMPRPNLMTTAVSTTASDTYSHAKKPSF
mmetsp:Transcript_19860/g.59978  ORF Transcript_19860/g.59978 Transcript_19860/m.59978 type:complete len:119 (+) Transcript_19860:131-487(+)